MILKIVLNLHAFLVATIKKAPNEWMQSLGAFFNLYCHSQRRMLPIARKLFFIYCARYKISTNECRVLCYTKELCIQMYNVIMK